MLAEIETGLLDNEPLSTLLQKCIVLGGHAGSEKLRDWARRELNGYGKDQELPEYRKLTAQAYIWITNDYGVNGRAQRINTADLPEAFQSEGLSLEYVPLAQGIGDLEALTRQEGEPIRLVPPWGSVLVNYLRKANKNQLHTHVDAVYWEILPAVLHGVLVRIRTALAELVGELIALTPTGHSVPEKSTTDQAVQLMITGDRNVVTYSPQHAGDGGANKAVVGLPQETAQNKGFWERLRKRGVLITVSTVVAAIVGVLSWLKWAPW